MGLWDSVTRFLALNPNLETRFELASSLHDYPSLDTQLANIRGYGTRPWRVASVEEALGVPAIQRAVSLIAETTGMLAMEGYRKGVRMNEPPGVISRPNPFDTPRDSYRDMAWTLASRGEAILFIATRDRDGYPSALVQAPNREITVEDNPRNRLFPIVRWGDVTSTWYSPANPTGEFVHITKNREVGDLRGKGPLQMCGAAVSVSVESQEWAANFYAEGGTPSTVIKSAVELDENEAEALRSQWVNKAHNVPRIIDTGIEDVQTFDVNAQGAQMLDAREHQNREAARLFGIPESMLATNSSGSSLTYQNNETEFNKFVKTCLQPGYLAPIEEALSDILPRSTTARFNVKGFLRADAKTRAEIYQMLIPLGVMTIEDARQEEGFDPGDVEFAPVAFAPPSAIPASIPQTRSEPVRCDGMRTFRRSGVTSLGRCNNMLAESGPFVGRCRKCKKVYEAA